MRKDLLIVAFIALLIIILASGTNIQSVEEYYLTHIDDINEDSKTVFIRIDASTVLENWQQLDPALRSEKYVPNDGVILENTEYVLRPNDTVFDILQRTIRHNKIHMEFQGADENAYNSVYIQGINHLYEFSAGPLSGWMYAVNGEFPNYGVSKYELEDGDEIEFLYTCDLGRDLGHHYLE
ncbi:DUF4430 domain-containing protein [Pseudogracilibacillus auburnensis]|uniref:Uncharacterized protein DUF4430 n=1 Tax=Pseudogracilibacillus auburnensis TaxID=1494959 RepID=A0A2V3VIG1_9BACI|nr:DUF4430 domain-containing protein [Pseudogracilibacillus auburnensis]PXW80994.1 uncharacterized protein DUF4430 [Pseudogracilibacillus auburnensis]